MRPKRRRKNSKIDKFDLNQGRWFMDMIWNSFLSLWVNIIYALLTAALAFGLFWVVDRYLLKKIDLITAVKDGNLAAAVFAGFLVLSISLILSFTMR